MLGLRLTGTPRESGVATLAEVPKSVGIVRPGKAGSKTRAVDWHLGQHNFIGAAKVSTFVKAFRSSERSRFQYRAVHEWRRHRHKNGGNHDGWLVVASPDHYRRHHYLLM